MTNYSKINYHQGNVIPDVLPKFTKSKPKTLLEERIETINREAKCTNDYFVDDQGYGKGYGRCPECNYEFTYSFEKTRGFCQHCDRITYVLRAQREEERNERISNKEALEAWSSPEWTLARFSNHSNIKKVEQVGNCGFVFQYRN